MAPLLSVIIPFYNGEKYVDSIAKAFDAQTCKDFELICVDDGSKDGTLSALKNFSSNCKDYGVKVLRQENAGVSAARNHGLDCVTGKYISFVDCDDYVTPDYVELLSKNLDKDFDVLVFQQKRIHSKDNFEVDVKSGDLSLRGNMEFMTGFAKNPTQYGVYNMFINKSYYDKYSFKFREGFKYYEDYEFMYRVFCMAKNLYVTDQQAYFYILHKGSAMQSFNVDRLTCIKILEDLRPFFSDSIPEFVPIFDIWCTSRIYWSIMWQACIAFSYGDAKKFAEMFNIKEKVEPLKKVADNKVRYSTWLLEKCLPAYILVVKFLGRSRSAIKKSGNLKDFKKVINEGINSSSGL